MELAETYPQIIEYEPSRYYEVTAFSRLVLLYEREGELWEALEFAERGARLHQEGVARKIEGLRARIAALEEEA